MHIKVNGELRAFDAPLSVQALAESLVLNSKQVAVERNGAIVSKSMYGTTMLNEGDAIEIVRFIGGG